jgi:hypothetical protein
MTVFILRETILITHRLGCRYANYVSTAVSICYYASIALSTRELFRVLTKSYVVLFYLLSSMNYHFTVYRKNPSFVKCISTNISTLFK